MEDFTINYCPENEIFPGWYTEKIPDAFLGKKYTTNMGRYKYQ